MNSHLSLAKLHSESFNNSFTTCEKCKLTFDTWTTYKRHMLNSKAHYNCCDICLIDFHKYEAFKKHMECAHSLEQSLNCFACGKTFPRLGALIGHLELSKCKSFSQRQLVDVRKQKQQNYESQKAARNFRDFNRCASRNIFNDEPLPKFSAVSPLISKRVAVEVPPLSNGLDEDLISFRPPESPENLSSINNQTDEGSRPTYQRTPKSNVGWNNPKPYAKSKAVVPTKEKIENNFDPRSHGFQADRYYLPLLEKYKCPHRGCTKTTESKNAFIVHLKSAAHRNDGLQCYSCLRFFATATALTQHCESQGVRCKVRELGNYHQVIDIITSGVANLAGRLEDNTIAYASTREKLDSTPLKQQHRIVGKPKDKRSKD